MTIETLGNTRFLYLLTKNDFAHVLHQWNWLESALEADPHIVRTHPGFQLEFLSSQELKLGVWIKGMPQRSLYMGLQYEDFSHIKQFRQKISFNAQQNVLSALAGVDVNHYNSIQLGFSPKIFRFEIFHDAQNQFKIDLLILGT